MASAPLACSRSIFQLGTQRRGVEGDKPTSQMPKIVTEILVLRSKMSMLYGIEQFLTL